VWGGRGGLTDHCVILEGGFTRFLFQASFTGWTRGSESPWYWDVAAKVHHEELGVEVKQTIHQGLGNQFALVG
jgi:hypothetical protein